MINKQKQKLTEDWFEPDQLIWLNGSFPAKYKKTDVKKTLNELGLKWTIKYTDDVTKIISRNTGWSAFKYPQSYNSIEDQRYRKIGQGNIYKPGHFMLMLRNMDSRDMSEHSRQIIDLLKTMDKARVKLAVTLIGDSLLEDRWIPWLLINKDRGTRTILADNNIGPGNWHVWNTKSNFACAAADLQKRLKIPADYMDEFMVDFYNVTK